MEQVAIPDLCLFMSFSMAQRAACRPIYMQICILILFRLIPLSRKPASAPSCLFFWDPSSFRISVFTWGNVASWRGSVILMMMMLIARYKLNMHSSSIQPGWIYFLCAPFTNE